MTSFGRRRYFRSSGKQRAIFGPNRLRSTPPPTYLAGTRMIGRKSDNLSASCAAWPSTPTPPSLSPPIQVSPVSLAEVAFGNTAWHNSVRARAYIKSAKTEDRTEPDKALASDRIHEVELRAGCRRHHRALEGWRLRRRSRKKARSKSSPAEAKADNAFLRLLERFESEGRTVGERPGHSYAPAVFSEEPEAKAAGLNKKALTDAMRRLFASKKIHIEQYGRPSRPASRLALGPAPERMEIPE